ncbi:MAG TPA: GntR family transcriptional regulator [Bryobacteraceae bacterium]|nr:GntR family transcriptional regulator [Bryobacteraceae bacterium]
MRDDARNNEFVSQTGRTLLMLRELLLKGEFRPGERLSELALVERLGVSRTPIRLAFDRLAHEGLVESAPSGGFVVCEFTMADIWDAIEMRGVLEGTAARLAAERLSDSSELAEIRGFQEQMDSLVRSVGHSTMESFAVYMNLNEAFHSELVELAKSPMLRRSLSHLTALPFASPSAMVFARSKLPGAAGMLTIGQEQHHSLLEALEKRQGTRAEALAREHVQLSRRNLESVLGDEAILRCVPGSSLILRATEINQVASKN